MYLGPIAHKTAANSFHELRSTLQPFAPIAPFNANAVATFGAATYAPMTAPLLNKTMNATNTSMTNATSSTRTTFINVNTNVNQQQFQATAPTNRRLTSEYKVKSSSKSTMKSLAKSRIKSKASPSKGILYVSIFL